MLKSFIFALHFAMAFMGLIIAIHINMALGLTMFIFFIVKFWLQLPQYSNWHNGKYNYYKYKN